MEVAMSLNAVVRLPLSSSRTNGDGLVRHSLFSTQTTQKLNHQLRLNGRHVLVVQAKGKKGMQSRQFQKAPPPSLPKIEDDGNPRFVIFIRAANVCSRPFFSFSFFFFRCGTTAKIMLAAKDNFLGKYIYKDTLARNLAAVIYRDEKEIQKTAFKQFRVLREVTDFRYGYKIVENGNLRAALTTSDVIELPTQDKLKTVLDKVKDFFGDAKESFGKITELNVSAPDESEENIKRKEKVKS
ncbi:hypothetical protein FEM48_Zijuj10G0043100 [Ziziphus jujuba var. spinosa]|uniref:Protein HHL1, chloroplastic n=1 Tax=Ziziphus jujuba var. spinosa TaxID=714518 RepID=A0A978UL92_ZIZJJ|nr:hypothetical protein FEM48_Zijuj10G0043100 [Ziziphus jujuba var. spinosa]